MLSDRDYGKGALDSAVVTAGQITFTGKEADLREKKAFSEEKP